MLDDDGDTGGGSSDDTRRPWTTDAEDRAERGPGEVRTARGGRGLALRPPRHPQCRVMTDQPARSRCRLHARSLGRRRRGVRGARRPRAGAGASGSTAGPASTGRRRTATGRPCSGQVEERPPGVLGYLDGAPQRLVRRRAAALLHPAGPVPAAGRHPGGRARRRRRLGGDLLRRPADGTAARTERAAAGRRRGPGPPRRRHGRGGLSGGPRRTGPAPAAALYPGPLPVFLRARVHRGAPDARPAGRWSG